VNVEKIATSEKRDVKAKAEPVKLVPTGFAKVESVKVEPIRTVQKKA